MGAPRNRQPWVLGTLAATVGALWLAACDAPAPRTGTPTAGGGCLNPQPLPPCNGAENSSGAGSSSSGAGSNSSGGSSDQKTGSNDAGVFDSGSSAGQTTESSDAGVFDAELPPREADASAEAAPEGGTGCLTCSGADSGDAAPADGSLDAP